MNWILDMWIGIVILEIVNNSSIQNSISIDDNVIYIKLLVLKWEFQKVYCFHEYFKIYYLKLDLRWIYIGIRFVIQLITGK